MRTLLGALVLVAIMSAPALAQRSRHYGYQYQSSYSYRSLYSNQSPARATIPRAGPLSDSPAATGGGSLGYNQNLWNW
jgi:hypothetical protein